MGKACLLTILLLWASSTLALQVKPALDNGTITASISLTDVTRIFVKDDRITSIKGVKGSYTHSDDDTHGDIYLQPTSIQTKAFSILITTEQGRHYTLQLNPKAVPSTTLMLVPQGMRKTEDFKCERRTSMDAMPTHLIKAMATGTRLPGFKILHIHSSSAYLLQHKARLHLITVYQGRNVCGDIYQLQNTSNQVLQLDERSFYRTGTVGISLEAPSVAAKHSIYVFRVVQNG